MASQSKKRKSSAGQLSLADAFSNAQRKRRSAETRGATQERCEDISESDIQIIERHSIDGDEDKGKRINLKKLML